jgi:hypothetical protein
LPRLPPLILRASPVVTGDPTRGERSCPLIVEW